MYLLLPQKGQGVALTTSKMTGTFKEVTILYILNAFVLTAISLDKIRVTISVFDKFNII